jgi:hypothetical protein
MPETTRNLSTFPQPFIHKNPACIVFQSFLSETKYKFDLFIDTFIGFKASNFG